jgi:hypothetical protein
MREEKVRPAPQATVTPAVKEDPTAEQPLEGTVQVYAAGGYETREVIAGLPKLAVGETLLTKEDGSFVVTKK